MVLFLATSDPKACCRKPFKIALLHISTSTFWQRFSSFWEKLLGSWMNRAKLNTFCSTFKMIYDNVDLRSEGPNLIFRCTDYSASSKMPKVRCCNAKTDLKWQFNQLKSIKPQFTFSTNDSVWASELAESLRVKTSQSPLPSSGWVKTIFTAGRILSDHAKNHTN